MIMATHLQNDYVLKRPLTSTSAIVSGQVFSERAYVPQIIANYDPISNKTRYQWEEEILSQLQFTDLHKIRVIQAFASELLGSSKKLEPDFAKIIKDNFWDLI